MKAKDRIFCAIDTTNLNFALSLGKSLKGLVGGLKIGKEFFTANGPTGVKQINALGMPVFLDLKFHDIPNTVAGAIKATQQIGCFMTTIHASGGGAMIRAAANAKQGKMPMILAVTVLTSLGEHELESIGIHDSLEQQVINLAKLARVNGADGIVASSHEIPRLRAELGKECSLVVPGIRPSWAATNDQKRTMTPAQAVTAGADFLVIGRPITQAKVPAEAAIRIAEEIGTSS